MDTIIENLPKIIDAGIKLLNALIEGIVDALPQLINQALDLVLKIVAEIISNLPQIIEAGIELIFALIDGIIDAIPDLVGAIPEVVGAIFEAFGDVNWKEIGIDIIEGLIVGVKSMAGALVDSVKNVVGNAVDGAKNLLGINSPSKVFEEIGVFSGQGLEKGLMNMSQKVSEAGQKMAEASIPTMQTQSIDNRPNETIFNFEGMLRGANFNVRNDRDIEQIARELGDYIKKGQRRVGVMVR